MKGDRRYAPSGCFETFPFPLTNDYSKQLIEEVGDEYLTKSTEMLSRFQIGLTDLYNLFHTREESIHLNSTFKKKTLSDYFLKQFSAFRQIAIALDVAVFEAYGLILPKGTEPAAFLLHDFYNTDESNASGVVRFTIHPKVMKFVLDALLQLDHSRWQKEYASIWLY